MFNSVTSIIWLSEKIMTLSEIKPGSSANIAYLGHDVFEQPNNCSPAIKQLSGKNVLTLLARAKKKSN